MFFRKSFFWCLLMVFLCIPAAFGEGNASIFTISPFYFVPNKAFNEKGTKIINQNQETVAFVQTLRGKVQFTPGGIFIGVLIPEKNTPNEKTRIITPETSEKVAKKLVVMGIEFKDRFTKRKRESSPILEEPANAKFNFLIGPRENWQVNVPVYKKLKYPDVWEGIDVEYTGYMDKLEYRLIIKPGGDLSRVEMETGAENLTTTRDGGLKAELCGAIITMTRPFAYQEINGEKVEVPVSYKILSNGSFTFEIGEYDKTKPLIIDPFLEWSTFLGGKGTNEEEGRDIAVDSEGNVYITGYTGNAFFPTTSGVYDRSFNGNLDVFVSKLRNDGSGLVFSTFIGGSNEEKAHTITVDDFGNVYIAGTTGSSDFPTTGHAFDRTIGGSEDGFVLKLNGDGSDLAFSTYLGGSNSDECYDITINSDREVFVTGFTLSSDFPTTNGAYSRNYQGSYDVFVTKLNRDGSSLVFSTLVGSTASEYGIGIAIDSNDNVYFTGIVSGPGFPVTDGAFDTSFSGYHTDGFVAKLSADGSTLIYSTYLGGSDDEEIIRIAVDSTGYAYVTGDTRSSDYPTTSGVISPNSNGLGEGVITKVNLDGTGLVFSTYLGGSNNDGCIDIVLDDFNNVYVTGYTNSTDFPTTDGCYDNTHNGEDDAFVAKINSNATAINYSSFLGGSDNDRGHGIARDRQCNIYIGGYTYSSNFPAINGYDQSFSGSSDAFVAKFNFDCESDFYTITATAGEGGTISPSGDVLVNSGDSITFTITPDENYLIEDVKVDNQSVGRVNTYTFENVKENHTIAASFATSLLPVITRAETENMNRALPVRATFSCDAYDPDGGNIVRYVWKIEGNNFSDTVITAQGKCNYVFTQPDTYSISVTVVDDEGETATATLKDNNGQNAVITAYKPQKFNMVIPIPSNNSGKFKAIPIEKTFTGIINPSGEEVNLTIKYYDKDGNSMDAQSYTIPPKGKFYYNPETYNTNHHPYALMETDNYILSYSKVISESGQMASYLLPNYNSKLYIPHIAEETDYWETNMFVFALQPTDLKVSVNTAEKQYSISVLSTVIDLEDLLGTDVNENKTWGSVESQSSNPFGGSASLSGFEIFQHNDTDGAGVELQSSGNTTLFIPHIPEETNIFWTGFAIVNPNNEDANLNIDLYTKEGELVDTVSLTIPAGSKLKGLAGDLFGNAYGNAEWGIIRSDKEILGIEIYGTVASGICGYSLPSLATTEGYLPELITGDNYWNGIALTNPSLEEATITISLVASDGTVKTSKDIQLGSMQRFKAVVKDFFESSNIESTDYIHYTSTAPVIAIEVSGDLDRTFMFSLVGKK